MLDFVPFVRSRNFIVRCAIFATSAILLAGFSEPCLAAEFTTIHLWEKGAPGTPPTKPQDEPELYVKLPTAPSTGTAVIILPGGGYERDSEVSPHRGFPDEPKRGRRGCRNGTPHGRGDSAVQGGGQRFNFGRRAGGPTRRPGRVYVSEDRDHQPGGEDWGHGRLDGGAIEEPRCAGIERPRGMDPGAFV